MNRWVDFRGVVLASRWPNLLIIGLCQLLSASMLIRHDFTGLFNLDLFLLVISTMLVAAGGYVINDYYDLKIDLVDRPEKVVVGKFLTRRKALITHILLSASAIGIGMLVSLKIGLMHLFSVSLLWYYSNHLRRFFIGKIAIACLTALCILAVGLAFEVVSYRLMAFATFGGAIVWMRELIKDLENRTGKAMFGVESVTSVWGTKGTKWLIAAIGLFGAGLLIYFMIKVDSTIFFFYYAGLSPLVVYFAYLLFRSDRQTHFKRLRQLSNLMIFAGLMSMLVI